jgi:hypothetical protein
MKKIIHFIIALFVPLGLFAQDITYAEYFIDTDPGFGEAASIPVSAPGTDLALNFSAALQSLDPGVHQIFIRAKDDFEKWGPVIFSTFLLVEIPAAGASDIQEMEYFIDTDPGYGNATSIPVSSPGTDLSFNITADLTALDPGMHQIYIRGKNVSGKWGVVIHGTFITIDIPASGASNIQALEYFIDNDPGYGSANPVSLSTTGTDLEITFDVPLTEVTVGDHVLYVRAKNELGQWGPVFIEAFVYSSDGANPEELRSLYKLYPNPASRQITLEITDEIHVPVLVKICDLHGAVVFETCCDDHPCIIEPGLPGGLYLINIKIDEHNITQKIIIK